MDTPAISVADWLDAINAGTTDPPWEWPRSAIARREVPSGLRPLLKEYNQWCWERLRGLGTQERREAFEGRAVRTRRALHDELERLLVEGGPRSVRPDADIARWEALAEAASATRH